MRAAVCEARGIAPDSKRPWLVEWQSASMPHPCWWWFRTESEANQVAQRLRAAIYLDGPAGRDPDNLAVRNLLPRDLREAMRTDRKSAAAGTD